MHDFLSFYIVVSKCEEWRKKHLYGLPWAAVSIATPLQWSMQWDITLLIQSENPNSCQ